MGMLGARRQPAVLGCLFLALHDATLGAWADISRLGKQQTCAHAGEGLSLAAVTVRLSGCWFAKSGVGWGVLFHLAKHCRQAWRAGDREDLPKRLPSRKVRLSAQKSLFAPSLGTVSLCDIWKLAVPDLFGFGTSLSPPGPAP